VSGDEVMPSPKEPATRNDAGAPEGETELIVFLLDGSTKAMLLHRQLLRAAAQGEGTARTVKLTVGRDSALSDTATALQAADVLSSPTCQPAAILHPAFRGEAGEGHGPRRELFTLLGQQLGRPAPASS
jgi:hypothetical protein